MNDKEITNQFAFEPNNIVGSSSMNKQITNVSFKNLTQDRSKSNQDEYKKIQQDSYSTNNLIATTEEEFQRYVVLKFHFR